MEFTVLNDTKISLEISIFPRTYQKKFIFIPQIWIKMCFRNLFGNFLDFLIFKLLEKYIVLFAQKKSSHFLIRLMFCCKKSVKIRDYLENEACLFNLIPCFALAIF